MTEPIRESIDGNLYRQAKGSVINEDKRTVELSFSSEEPYLRDSYFEDPWYEILGHKEDEIDLSRLNNGATFHYNHSLSREDRIGGVMSAKVVKDRGVAQIQFSKGDRVNDIWEDVRDGLLTNISIGYTINERTLVKTGEGETPDTFRVTRWTPHEISVVDVPADPTVGIGRSKEPYPVKRSHNHVVTPINFPEQEIPMEKKIEPSVDPITEPVVVDNAEEIKAAAERGRLEGINAEQTRQLEVRSVLKPLETQLGDSYATILDESITDPTQTVSKVRERVLTKLGEAEKPVAGNVTTIEQDNTAFRAAMVDSLQIRAGVEDPDVKDDQSRVGRDFAGYSLVELARTVLSRGGGKVGGSAMEMLGRSFSTTDFPTILADVANKSMLRGYDESPETWSIWCQVGSLSNYNVAQRINLSSFDSLLQIREGQEYRYGTFQEQGATIQLATYGKLFSITRQALINDDLSVFTRIPAGMGRAASRAVGDLAYGALTSNPTLADNVTLFHSTHKNIAGVTGPPKIDTISAMRVLMQRQTDASGNATALNIRPGFLLCSVEREDAARVFQTSIFDPNGAHSQVPNTVQGSFETVSDARLSQHSTTQWYLVATRQFDTVEVAFLNGQQQPLLETQAGWSIDGTEFKVRLDVAAAPMEHRTMVRNEGA